MISSLVIGGVTIDNSTYLLTRLEGLNDPVTRLATYNKPDRDGAGLSKQVYDKRILFLRGFITGETLNDYLANRRELAAAFRFRDALKTLQINLADGEEIQIDVITRTEFRADQEPGETMSGLFEVELEAPDPLLYAQDASLLTVYETTISGGTAIPTAIPLSLTAGEEGETYIATNNGNYPVYPTIRLWGPGTGFNIGNQASGETLYYGGTLTAAQYLDIDLKAQTAKLMGITNVYGDMGGDWWDLEPGANLLSFIIDSGKDENTNFVMSWRDAYIGV